MPQKVAKIYPAHFLAQIGTIWTFPPKKWQKCSKKGHFCRPKMTYREAIFFLKKMKFFQKNLKKVKKFSFFTFLQKVKNGAGLNP